MSGKTTQCECCFMPLGKDNGKRTSEKYCSMCYADGKLLAENMSLAEFQQVSYDGMRKEGFWLITAWFFSFLIRFAPYWKTRSNKGTTSSKQN